MFKVVPRARVGRLGGRHWLSSVGLGSRTAERVEVEEGGEVVRVQWEGGREHSSFLAAWLRYNCASNRSECGDRVGMAAGEVDVGQRVERAGVEGRSVEVLFEGGHHSSFHSAWLWEHSWEGVQAGKQARREARREWGPTGQEDMRDSLPGCASVGRVLDEESKDGLWSLASNVNLYGFALVAGGSGEDVAERVARRLGGGHVQQSNYGSTFEVVARPQFPMNAAYSCVSLEPHMDVPFYESAPGIQVLHCLQNEASGGESTLVDALAAADRLRSSHPSSFDVLCRTGAQWAHVDCASHYSRVTPHIAVSAVDGEVIGVRWNPFIEGTPVVRSARECKLYYEAYSLFAGMLASPEHSLRFRLREGDVLVFNNRRMAHGRAAFLQPEGDSRPSRHLRGAYAPVDEFHSVLRLLCAEYGAKHGVHYPVFPLGNYCH